MLLKHYLLIKTSYFFDICNVDFTVENIVNDILLLFGISFFSLMQFKNFLRCLEVNISFVWGGNFLYPVKTFEPQGNWCEMFNINRKDKIITPPRGYKAMIRNWQLANVL